MKIEVYTVSAFTKEGKGGNLAGVVVGREDLTEEGMQEIARRVGYSETAFVQTSLYADFKLRFFTPTEEVDLCGHATIGAFGLLAQKGWIKVGRYTQETKAGILQIEVKPDLSIMMEQPLPVFFEEVSREEVADSLGIKCEGLAKDLPVQIVSTGLKDVLIPVKDYDTLKAIKPDWDQIIQVCKQYGAIGYHVFTLSQTSSVQAYCRNFAPLVGILEEFATGTSNGALGCYLHKYHQLDKALLDFIEFEQGIALDERSKINVSLEVEKEKLLKVMVGGHIGSIKCMTL